MNTHTTPAAPAADVTLCCDTARRLTDENTALRRELRAATERAAALDARVQYLQRANESAYDEAYDRVGGPHFCTGQPLGQDPNGQRSVAALLKGLLP